MEQNTFPYRGKTFTVTLGGNDAVDTIKVDYPGDSNIYIDELGDINKISKKNKIVKVAYREYINKFDGSDLVDNVKEFDATSQETFNYFYDMILGNVRSLGTSFDRLVQDGLLIDKYGLQQGVYGPDGNFYYPIWFDYKIETFSTDVEGEPVYDYNITINIPDKLENEVYTYTLINTGVSQTENVFTQLPFGTYIIMAESPRSMPYYETIVIPEGYITPSAL